MKIELELSLPRQWGKIPLPSAVCIHSAPQLEIWNCSILTVGLWEYPGTVLGKASICWIPWLVCDQTLIAVKCQLLIFFAEFILDVSVVSMWIALVPAHCCGSSSSSWVRGLVLFQHMLEPKKPLSRACVDLHIWSSISAAPGVLLCLRWT